MGEKSAKKAAKAAKLAAHQAIQSAADRGHISPNLQEHLRAAGLLKETKAATTEGGNFSQEAKGHGNEQASEEGVTIIETAFEERATFTLDEAPTEVHAAPGIRSGPFTFGWNNDHIMDLPSGSLETEPFILTPSTSTVDSINDTKDNGAQGKAVPEPSIKGTIVARCRSCPRMAWFRSPSRHLAEIVVSGAEDHGGVVFMRCGRCCAGKVDSWSGEPAPQPSIDVCPGSWRGSDVIRIAESLAGREMHVIADGRGGTAVIDLLSLIRKLLDNEEWGEVLEADYNSGKRGQELCSKAIKGGLI